MRRVAVLVVALAALILVAPALAGGRPTIYIWNSSTIIRDATIADALPVWQKAVDEDFAPLWNADARLVFIGSDDPPQDAWQIEVADYADVFGALAYHGTYGAWPYARVFAKTALADPDDLYNWEVSLTHELFEMLADPGCNRLIEVDDGVFYRLEVADPVEADRFAYWRISPGGVPVAISDFVTEAWYDPLAPGPYDFAGHVTEPLQVLKGGYIPIWRGKGKWTFKERFRPTISAE